MRFLVLYFKNLCCPDFTNPENNSYKFKIKYFQVFKNYYVQIRNFYPICMTSGLYVPSALVLVTNIRIKRTAPVTASQQYDRLVPRSDTITACTDKYSYLFKNVSGFLIKFIYLSPSVNDRI